MNSAFPADILHPQVSEPGPDARVVTVTGEVDTLTAPELAACLIGQLAVAHVVVVNLDGVRLLASAGLTVLFQANELATQHDRDLRLVCNSRTANRTLEATGLREHLPFADNLSMGSQSTSPLAVGQLRIVLTANQALPAGLDTSVTLQFRDAGRVTLQVPMGTSSDTTS